MRLPKAVGSSVSILTNNLYPLCRIKVKKGLQVTAARPAQPTFWTAKLDRFKGSKHHTSLITCHRAGPAGPDSRCLESSSPRVLGNRFGELMASHTGSFGDID